MPTQHFGAMTPNLQPPCDTAQLGRLGHAQRSHPSTSYESSCSSRGHHHDAIDLEYHILHAEASEDDVGKSVP